ncbi:flagellin [Methylobacterium sp. Leaf104]|uniref:flagellin N-terminal helical domain-containing protein n=1 Tax=Methylobacterium TaxID=407 RepID=UPI000700EDAD|nr:MULTISPECIES: flagellin [Methylobacterium]KQP29903.1 flagellin [Methylobacterium sp. Leaf104]MCI9882403.1 flagellin [Methylobacterium goesingense]
MTSLLTNNAAMTALTTLKSINAQLDSTSNRVSTGQRVSSAADNAAYWSIATTVRTDNLALGAVKDSLGLGSAAVDTAYNGLTSVLTNLQNIRTKLQTALQPGVDRNKVQTEIASLQSNMKSTADSSTQSGQNWLSVDSSATGYNSGTQKVVAGFSRDATGHISFSTVDIDVKSIQLYDKALTGSAATTAKVTASSAVTGTLDFSGTNQSTLSVTLATGGAQTITLTAASLTAHVADLTKVTKDELVTAINNSIASNTTLKGNVTASLDSAGRIQFETPAGANSVSVNIASATNAVNIGFGIVPATVYSGAGTAAGTGSGGGILDKGGTASVAQLSISSSTTDATLQGYIDTVDKAIAAVTTAGTKLGANKTQVDGQKTFIDTLMKSNDRAIGTLVDADIEEESTKLKALQTQQQLGVQALSIANSSSQNVLSLFR